MTPLLLITGLVLLGLTAVWPWLFYAVLLVGFLALLTAMIENRDTDQSCPNCGQFCTGKSVFCTPPIDDDGGEARP